MRPLAPLLAGLALLVVAAPVGAHGTIEAREVETLLLVDEADDSFYTTGGYDVYELYIGEAHMPEVGAGAAGDGFYLRTILFGNFEERPPGTQEYRVEFAFDAPEGPMTRFLATTDGKTFETDFDHLMITAEPNEVSVDRAFVSFTNASLARQMALRNFQVTSLVDGEVRDRAPGGIFVPGSGGQVEVPMPSEVRAESYTLEGPVKYVTASAVRNPSGNYTVTLQSLLKDGEQHVRLEAPAGAEFTVTVPAEHAGVLKAGETRTVHLEVVPQDLNGDGLVAPAPLDVLSDIGGRFGFVVTLQNNTPALLPEGAVSMAQPFAPEAPLEVPFTGAFAAVALLVALAALRRRA